VENTFGNLKIMNVDINIKHVVRIAPSPTGVLHIGTLRTAYFNWLIANQNDDSKLIVRIDDTDLSRSQDDLIQPIYDTLTDYGLDWDITFKQSDRFYRYTDVAQSLVDSGKAIHKDGAIMLDNAHAFSLDADNADVNWTDTLTGPKLINNNLNIDGIMRNQVIIKSDGSPTYHFANVIDDIDFGVTWVVRGTDHIGNTAKQVLIYNLLGQPLPLYTHVGLVCHLSGKKVSKRDSDSLGMSQYNPDAVLNYVLRLGWSPSKDDKTNNIIPKDKAVKMFLSDGKMRAPNCKFDLKKLQWYDKKYNYGIN
jgi:glutamyl-tRNA synthetase